MLRGAHPVRAEERDVVRGDRAVGFGRGDGAAAGAAAGATQARGAAPVTRGAAPVPAAPGCRSGWPSRLTTELCEDGGEAARRRHWGTGS